jgi:hypothetical protein
MWEGQIERVCQEVAALPGSSPEARESRRATLQYYRHNRHRMQYDQYRLQGFEIGSGRIESACKQVVSARIKGAGMRWSESGARAIGCLRALLLSTGGWDRRIGQWAGRGLTPVTA